MANGAKIKNEGEKVLKGVTSEGLPLGFTAQITDVTKTLCSVSKIVAAGNKVVFNDDDGCNRIINKVTGAETPMFEKDGTYRMNLWVWNPNAKTDEGNVADQMGFQRQGNKWL